MLRSTATPARYFETQPFGQSKQDLHKDYEINYIFVLTNRMLLHSLGKSAHIYIMLYMRPLASEHRSFSQLYVWMQTQGDSVFTSPTELQVGYLRNTHKGSSRTELLLELESPGHCFELSYLQLTQTHCR